MKSTQAAPSVVPAERNENALEDFWSHALK